MRTEPKIRYGLRVEEKKEFGRQVLTIWTGAFSEQYEGHAVELPDHDGFMVRLDYSDPIRVACPAPRDEKNYEEVDAAINAAINAAALTAAPKDDEAVEEVLTPYDTGDRLEPKPWHVQPRNLSKPDKAGEERDRYGRVDFDNDAGETAMSVVAKRGPHGPILEVTDWSEWLTIKWGNTEIKIPPQ